MSALGWDVFKWWHSERIKLDVSASVNMLLTTDPLKQKHVMMVVRNQSKFTTTLSLVSFETYDSWWKMKRRKPAKLSVVPNPSPGIIPHVLEPGKEWMGLTLQNNSELMQYRKYKYVTFSIHHSMGKSVRARVLLPKD